MTRTDVMASSRPQKADAASIRRGSSGALRGLVIVPLVLLVLALVPGVAAAAEPTSGYTTTTPTTTGYSQTTPTTTTTATPATGTLPSKEAEKPTPTTPTAETAPAKTSSTPTPKASTLPFTGFDLRWDLGLGLLLMLAGVSIVAVQRRQHRNGGS
ncbi:MAG TPA: hypothetical protein VGX72_07185 [Solirubrobacteraceae bacterium]|nr:hypothetical protein [Solirubrobacteraceae bacterium]